MSHEEAAKLLLMIKEDRDKNITHIRNNLYMKWDKKEYQIRIVVKKAKLQALDVLGFYETTD